MLVKFKEKEYDIDSMKDWEKRILKSRLVVEIRNLDDELRQSALVRNQGKLQFIMMNQAKLESIINLLNI